MQRSPELRIDQRPSPLKVMQRKCFAGGVVRLPPELGRFTVIEVETMNDSSALAARRTARPSLTDSQTTPKRARISAE
jgi:hypothetical protein